MGEQKNFIIIILKAFLIKKTFHYHLQGPEEAYTPYTNYRGPGLRGARRAPELSWKLKEIRGKKRKGREKKEKEGKQGQHL